MFGPNTLILYVVLCVLLFLVQVGFFRSLWTSVKETCKRCPHGARRGRNGGCPSCVADNSRQLAESQANLRELARKDAIAKEAEELRASELRLISEKWLSRAEVYLQMDPRQFENAVAELFRALGYKVAQTPYTNDRGRDAVATKDGKIYLIECKRYDESNTIGRPELQKFVAAMLEENANGGFYINTGRFARTAWHYAAQNRIELYDRTRLPGLVGGAYTRIDVLEVRSMCLKCGDIQKLPVEEATSTCSCIYGHQIINTITTELIRRLSFAPETVCERCGSEMRLTDGRYRKLLQCSRFPRCRFSRKPSRAYLAKTSAVPSTERVSSPKPELTYETLKARIADVEARIAKEKAAALNEPAAFPVEPSKVEKPQKTTKLRLAGATNAHFREQEKRMTSAKPRCELVGPTPLSDESKTLEDVAYGEERWFELYGKRDHHDAEEGMGYRFHNWRYERIIKEIHRLREKGRCGS